MRAIPIRLPAGSKGLWYASSSVLLVAGAVTAYLWLNSRAAPGQGVAALPIGDERVAGKAEPAAAKDPAPVPIQLTTEDQEAFGLKTARVETGPTLDVVKAPGKITPNESHYAFITPRSPGVIRSVTARMGQEVEAGDLLATIDSSQVAEARLNLVTRLQQEEVARSRAEWQGTILRGTLELIGRLKAGDTPDEIQKRFAGRPVGENRERLMTAYSQYRLTKVAAERSRFLRESRAESLADLQTKQAEYEAAQATYQSLMDLMEFESKLAESRARQEASQAEVSVQVARERLRVLGVKPDGVEPKISGGRVVGVRPDGTLKDRPAPPKPEAILAEGGKEPAVSPVGSSAAGSPGEEPHILSTYSMWAPFRGTIIDRAAIAPGIAVDETHHLFTLADLSSVWVEINVHEGDFAKLVRSRDAKVRLTSAAYPSREFEAKVIYSGDVVEERSRSILLLARADNPDRMLKPGMYVEAEVLCPSDRTAVLVPRSALLTEGEHRFVFVRTGPDRFERRDVAIGLVEDGRVAVLRGLGVSDEVVIEGGFKLKTLAERLKEEGPAT